VINVGNHFAVIEWLTVKKIPWHLREDSLLHLLHPQAVFLMAATSAVLFMKLSQMERESPMFTFVANIPKCNKPEFEDVVARVESLRARMGESDVSPSGERQVEGLFESLLAEAFS
jgi:hypothetical protein